jgi:hypothetical protein
MYKYAVMENISNLARTTIVLDTKIRDKLKQYGTKGDTYEDIVVKLMEFYDTHSIDKRPFLTSYRK